MSLEQRSYDSTAEHEDDPASVELPYAGQTLVLSQSTPTGDGALLPLGTVGRWTLYMVPHERVLELNPVAHAPIIPQKLRGALGVDARVNSSVPFDSAQPDATQGPPRVKQHEKDGALRVAVIDTSFTGPAYDSQHERVVLDSDVERVGLPVGAYDDVKVGPVGHGARVTACLLKVLELIPPEGKIGVRRFQLPIVEGGVPTYVAPTQLALAIVAAIAWGARVILIAMSDAHWGTPQPLRVLLDEVASAWVGSAGVPVVCSVGDSLKRADDGAAFGADDLCSQPGTIAVSGCDGAGQWLRRETPLNRLGPGILCAAYGESFHEVPAELTADDSSQASAIVAAVIASLLSRNPALGVNEVRQLLATTTTRPAAVEGPEPKEFDTKALNDFNEWDSVGHNFKLGHGILDHDAAVAAATDPLLLAIYATKPTLAGAPALGSPPTNANLSFRKAFADSWNQLVTDARSPELDRYRRIRGLLVRVALHSYGFRERLLWLARHLRGLHSRSSWLPVDRNHDGLMDRIQIVFETLEDRRQLEAELPALLLRELEQAEVAEWAGACRRRLDSELVLSQLRLLEKAIRSRA